MIPIWGGQKLPDNMTIQAVEGEFMLSNKFIIAGNVPASLLSTGTVDEVGDYCDNLVALFKDSPAYILSHGCFFEDTTDEKLHAFIDSVKK